MMISSNAILYHFLPLTVCLSVSMCHDEKYLLYDVSPSEGFNLRRDVYLRIARFAKEIEYTLVLPPWGPLPHWKGPTGLKWENFFDVERLNNYTKVIEFRDFMDRFVGDVLIDHVYVLRHAPLSKSLDDTYYPVECGRNVVYRLEKSGVYEGNFFNEERIKARYVTCLEVNGVSSSLASLFEKDSIVMLDHAEVVLHDSFGDKEYWRLRKSMVFAKKLQNEAAHFIKTRFGDEKFLAVHLRRSDFPIVRPNDVPSIKGAAEQVKKLMRQRGLKNIFLATDGDEKEVEEFLRLVPETLVYHTAGVRFENSENLIENSSRDLCDGADPAKGLAVLGVVTKQCSGNRGDLDQPCRPLAGFCGSLEENHAAPKALSMVEKTSTSVEDCLNEDQDRTVSMKREFSESCDKFEASLDKPSVPMNFCKRKPASSSEAVGAEEEILRSSQEKCENEHEEKGVEASSNAKLESKSTARRCFHQSCHDSDCSPVSDRHSEPQLTGKSDTKAVEQSSTEAPQSCDCSDGTELGMTCEGDTCKPGEGADYIEGEFHRPPAPSLTEGQIAIVDQIICSMAEVFVGSFESTFSFRIQEEREILGRAPDTTFNRLCADGETDCQQPTRWTIVN